MGMICPYSDNTCRIQIIVSYNDHSSKNQSHFSIKHGVIDACFFFLGGIDI